MSESIHMKPADGEGCEIHDLPSEGLAKVLISLMQERHGKGGINVCRECITRAKDGVTPKCPEHGSTAMHRIEKVDYHLLYCSSCRWEKKIPRSGVPVKVTCVHGRPEGVLCPHCSGL